MFGARQFARSAPRFSAQMRTVAQRRFASSGQNEFITERQHIKEHAQGTTGMGSSATSKETANEMYDEES